MRQPTLFDLPAPTPSFPAQPAAPEQPAEWVPLSTLVGAEPAGPHLTGIARMAADATELDFRNEVDYRELPCKSLLAPVNSQRVPIDFSINPYRGCEFGCAYCYARYTHEYMEFEDWLDFERKIFVKQGAREALVRDLRRLDLRGSRSRSAPPPTPTSRPSGGTASPAACWRCSPGGAGWISPSPPRAIW